MCSLCFSVFIMNVWKKKAATQERQKMKLLTWHLQQLQGIISSGGPPESVCYINPLRRLDAILTNCFCRHPPSPYFKCICGLGQELPCVSLLTLSLSKIYDHRKRGRGLVHTSQRHCVAICSHPDVWLSIIPPQCDSRDYANNIRNNYCCVPIFILDCFTLPLFDKGKWHSL